MLKGISVLPKGRFQKVTFSIEQQYTVILTTLVEELQCFSSFHVLFISFWNWKTNTTGEKSDLSRGWIGTFQGAKSNKPTLQGLVDLMVFLQQHVQESSCMLDMDMAASIHWMLLEVRFKKKILWLELGKSLERCWYEGGCADPVGVAIFPTFVGSFVGLKSAWKAVLRCSK